MKTSIRGTIIKTILLNPLLGVGGTKIWVCGSCVQTKAKTFNDGGICYF